MKPKKILFICKHNRFRSVIAEAVFKKFNKKKNIKVSSAGIFQGLPIAKNLIRISKKYNLKLKQKPQAIQEKWFKELDLIVIVASDVPKKLFKNRIKKVIVWKIPDCSCSDNKCIEKTSKKIIKKVENFVRRLG